MPIKAYITNNEFFSLLQNKGENYLNSLNKHIKFSGDEILASLRKFQYAAKTEILC